MSVDLAWEWESGDGVAAPEHRATWARLECRVDGEWVTRVEDLTSGSSRRSIYCSLYPLAEWIAYNWWLLVADARPAATMRGARRPGVGSGGTQSRHNMRSAGDGFVWPDLTIIPQGRRSLVTWRRDRGARPHAPVRYLTDGEVLVEAQELQVRLTNLVEAVLGRLAEQGIAGTPLGEEWEAIRSADAQEREFCIAAARLGLDPYSDGQDRATAITDASRDLPAEVVGDFLDGVDVASIGDAVTWVRQAMALATARDTALPDRLRIADRLANGEPPGEPPWLIGWRQADEVRSRLGIGATESAEIERWLRPEVAATRPAGLQALGRGASATVVVSPQLTTEAQRFTLARALWHLVVERESLFLVTAAHTERQRIERAFAAELLAPAEGIRQKLGEAGDDDDLAWVAAEYRVSPLVVFHQVRNQLGEVELF